MSNFVVITRNGKDTGRGIDRDKNHAYTESLLPLPHIVEAAYKRGIYEFYNGIRVDRIPSEVRALYAAKEEAFRNRQLRKIAEINARLNELYPTKEQAQELHTLMQAQGGYVTTVASNPYSANTFYALEWQRGFDTGFNRTRIKNLGKV